MAVPTKITGVTVTPLSTTSVRVEWDEEATATEYYLYYKLSSVGGWTIISGITPETYDITPMATCVNYDYKVSGYNGDGEGTASDEVVQRPLCDYATIFSEATGLTEEQAGSTIHYDEFSEDLGLTEEQTGITGKWFSEAVGLLESFEERTQDDFTAEMSEDLGLTESFAGVHSSPITTLSESMICSSGNILYDWGISTLSGVVEMLEVDFGYPGKMKTLRRIQIISSRASVHTVTCKVSIDNGDSWSTIGNAVVGLTDIGYFFPWVAGEKFVVRFEGASLSLDAVKMWADPLGWEIGDEA